SAIRAHRLKARRCHTIYCGRMRRSRKVSWSTSPTVGDRPSCCVVACNITGSSSSVRLRRSTNFLPLSRSARDVHSLRRSREERREGKAGVARLRLPEKLARTLADEELPQLDRPVRFIVTRGARGAARANTLHELQIELDRPFTEKELADLERHQEDHRRERQ